MSMPKRMTINCSKCGHQMSVTAFQSVNTDYADNIEDQIISGDLFVAKCAKCGSVSHMEYDMLYNDMKHMAMIWVIHKRSPKYAAQVAEVRAADLVPYKTKRIVEDMNALREKVACLEMGRDDRIIELSKVFLLYNLLDQRPDFDFRNAFYTTLDGNELIFFYNIDGEEVGCELSNEVYNYINELYTNSDYVKDFDDNYAIVDFKWAKQVFDLLVEGEVASMDTTKETNEDEITVELESKSLFCRKCGAKLFEDSQFCDKCGTKVISRVEDSNMRTASKTNAVDCSQSVFAKLVSKGRLLKERIGTSLKRRWGTLTDEQKKKIIKIAVVVVSAAIILTLMINDFAKAIHNSELRNFATETMSEDYTNVYADIVSMEPEYFVYTSSNNALLHISEIVCKCVTIEGKSIWIVVDTGDYPGGSNWSLNEDSYKPQYYSKSNPKRISGEVTTSGQVIDELQGKIGNVFVLSVTKRIGE